MISLYSTLASTEKQRRKNATAFNISCCPRKTQTMTPPDMTSQNTTSPDIKYKESRNTARRSQATVILHHSHSFSKTLSLRLLSLRLSPNMAPPDITQHQFFPHFRLSYPMHSQYRNKYHILYLPRISTLPPSINQNKFRHQNIMYQSAKKKRPESVKKLSNGKPRQQPPTEDILLFGYQR